MSLRKSRALPRWPRAILGRRPPAGGPPVAAACRGSGGRTHARGPSASGMSRKLRPHHETASCSLVNSFLVLRGEEGGEAGGSRACQEKTKAGQNRCRCCTQNSTPAGSEQGWGGEPRACLSPRVASRDNPRPKLYAQPKGCIRVWVQEEVADPALMTRPHGREVGLCLPCLDGSGLGFTARKAVHQIRVCRRKPHRVTPIFLRR